MWIRLTETLRFASNTNMSVSIGASPGMGATARHSQPSQVRPEKRAVRAIVSGRPWWESVAELMPKPGLIELTRTFLGPSSFASTRVTASTAPFVVQSHACGNGHELQKQRRWSISKSKRIAAAAAFSCSF
jgi:hypothetical protein